MNDRHERQHPEPLPEPLQRWLEASTPTPPPPDWNELTARLDQRPRRRLRRWLWALGAPAAAAAAVALALRPGGPVPEQAQTTFELIAQLEMFEAYDMLAEVDPDTLALLAEVEP